MVVFINGNSNGKGRRGQERKRAQGQGHRGGGEVSKGGKSSKGSKGEGDGKVEGEGKGAVVGAFKCALGLHPTCRLCKPSAHFVDFVTCALPKCASRVQNPTFVPYLCTLFSAE